MVSCPNCRAKNEDSSNFCNECMSDLRDIEEFDNETLLITVMSEEEALVLESLLTSEGILSYRRDDRVGDFLKISTGFDEVGFSIYVSEKDYDFALDLISSDPITSEHLDDEAKIGKYPKQEQSYEQENSLKNIAVSLLIVLIILAIFLTSR